MVIQGEFMYSPERKDSPPEEVTPVVKELRARLISLKLPIDNSGSYLKHGFLIHPEKGEALYQIYKNFPTLTSTESINALAGMIEQKIDDWKESKEATRGDDPDQLYKRNILDPNPKQHTYIKNLDQCVKLIYLHKLLNQLTSKPGTHITFNDYFKGATEGEKFWLTNVLGKTSPKELKELHAMPLHQFAEAVAKKVKNDIAERQKTICASQRSFLDRNFSDASSLATAHEKARMIVAGYDSREPEARGTSAPEMQYLVCREIERAILSPRASPPAGP